MLRHMDQFVSLCVDVLTDIKNDAISPPSAVDDSYTDYDSSEETIHGGLDRYDAKLHASVAACAVGRADARAFVRGRMDKCCRFVGEAAWNELVVGTVEPVVLEQLAKLLND